MRDRPVRYRRHPLDESFRILSTINQNINQGRAVIKPYLGVENRKEALRDAKFVVNAIQVVSTSLHCHRL